ncbi:hypothetical protein BN2475_1020018 [Paraburkholderia ribeironis]|uniref:Uncharacterized protein n=1 Tax=Paraburkholderia ribeironis TaxID=1247936 RepID=A0A1N7SLZ4_9BURK|nr:hypothetical protein BN2475_1020018 [Paraburkholderia ribeironis]
MWSDTRKGYREHLAGKLDASRDTASFLYMSVGMYTMSNSRKTSARRHANLTVKAHPKTSYKKRRIRGALLDVVRS